LALIRIKLEAGFNPLFLAWFFTLPYGNSFIQKKNREGVKAGLNFDDIRSFQVVKPPIDLQNQFAAIVEKVEELKSRYQQSLTDLESLYGALSQKAFKGELDLSRVVLPDS
jgi:type I restriction enzyme, S subunit